MNPANPIIPPQSPLHRTRAAAGRKLAVSILAILTVHAFLLAELLIQGCKREDRPAGGTQETAPTAAQSLPFPALSNSAPTPPASVPALPSTNPIVALQPVVTMPVDAEPSRAHPTVSKAAARDRAGTTVASTQSTGESDKPSGVYIVKKGDNLTSIARAHGTTAKAIRAANNLKTDRLLVGKKLKVPGAPHNIEGKASPAVSTNVPPLVLPQ